MSRRSMVFAAIVLVQIVFVLPAPSFAQLSFDFAGAENRWLYSYYGQLGSRGFFGTYDVDAGAGTGGSLAPLNGWVGNLSEDVGELVAGSDAAGSSLGLAVQPSLGNEWVRLKGRYTIATYDTATAPGAYVAMSPAQMTMWSIDVDTPYVTLGYGKRVFVRGLGLQFSANRTQEYFSIEQAVPVPDILGSLVRAGLLPRSMHTWFNPASWGLFKAPREPPPEIVEYRGADGNMKWCVRPTEDILPDDPSNKLRCRGVKPRELDINKPPEMWRSKGESPWQAGKTYRGAEYGPARLILGVGVLPWQQMPLVAPVNAQWNLWNTRDMNAARSQNYMGYLLYQSTDLTLGAGAVWASFHQGPELQRSTALRSGAPTVDTGICEGWTFLRYSNRRFFFNTELDWFNRLVRYQRSQNNTFFGTAEPADGSGSLFAPDYWESWRYMAEAGMWFGPGSVRFFFSWLPGPDRRHGILIDRQPFIQENPQQAFGLFDPYSMLLAYRYGGGVDSQAYLADARTFAVKVDYAVASNLIFEASALSARRNSHGYGLGFVRPNPALDGLGRFDGTVDYGIRGSWAAPSPAIPDDDLGWEVGAGFIWELLQGWAISARVAYWQPGRWFNFACVDKAVAGWDNPTIANNWGVNPNRKIDPVVGIELSFGGTY